MENRDSAPLRQAKGLSGHAVHNKTAYHESKVQTQRQKAGPILGPEAKRAGGLKLQPLPSSKLNVPTSEPFASKKERKTPFSTAYYAGKIPCRISHSGSQAKCKLQWDEPPSSLDYNPLLVTVAEGLRETEHPYSFVAAAAFEHLMQAQDAQSKTEPLIGQLIGPIRAALMHADKDVFLRGLAAISQLSTTVGEALNPHLPVLLGQVARKLFNKTLQGPITETLQTLERRGGPGAYNLIKTKVGTYSSACGAR